MKIVLSYCEDPLTLSRASAACKTWNAVLADPTNSKMWFDFHNFARLKGPVLKYHRPLGWPKTGSSYTLAALLAPRSNEDAAGTLRALRSCHRMTKEELAVTINYDAKESKNFDHGVFGFWGGDHDDIMSDYEVGYLAYAGGVNIGTAGCQLICVDSWQRWRVAPDHRHRCCLLPLHQEARSGHASRWSSSFPRNATPTQPR